MRRHLVLLAVLAVASSLLTVRAVALAPAAEAAPSSPTETATATLSDPSILVAAGSDAGNGPGDPRAYWTSTALGSFMPTEGSTFGLISTGNAEDAPQPNDEGNLSTTHGGEFSKLGNNDLAQLVMTMTVPAGANCLGFDFVFYSDEFPEFIGSSFNDTFTAEVGRSELSLSGSEVVAPRNFVLDPNGDFITVNNAFGVSAANAAGTTYDGATPLLRTQTPITGSQVVLILSIADLGDSIYDSTVFVDNVAAFQTDECKQTTSLQGGQKPQPCLGPTWYFSEGTTRDGFDEFLALFNVTTETVTVDVDYLFADGSPPVTRTYSLPATSRQTVAVWEEVGRGLDISMVVRARYASTNLPAPIATERAIYFNFPSGRGFDFNGSHTVRGEPAPFPDWFFGEGTTLDSFDEYLTIQNPGSAQTVDISYALSDGAVIARTMDLAENSRTTVPVFDPDLGVGRGVEGVSTRVTARESGILVERPMYFNGTFSDGTGSILANGGHVDFGNVPDDLWYLSEGNVLPGWFQFLTIYNPNSFVNPTTIEYQLEGQAPITKTFTAPATSRTTVKVYDAADPLGIGRDVSDPVSRGVSVRVTTDDPAGVVVERPMYFQANFPEIPLPIDDGTGKTGSRFLKQTWYFSEGTTRPDFDYFFTFQNPSTDTVAVQVRYFLQDGSVVTRGASLPPTSRTTVQIWSPEQVDRGALGMRGEIDFAAEITSSELILVERPSYTQRAFPDIAGTINGGSVVFGLPDPCI